MAVIKRKDQIVTHGALGHNSTQLLDGNYYLSEVIGRGGNSVVYSASPTEKRRLELLLPQQVTIKIFSDSALTPELIARVQTEAMCLKSINSERVIKLYEYSASLESSYLVLEFAEHGDLKSLMERLGKLERAQALRFGIQLLAAVEAVHQAGIIHRDIKPENLLIGADGTLKLSDFGVSAFVSGTQHQNEEDSLVRGTLGYIAPEQLAGQQETPQSDIFACGVTIFELLTNRLPFEAISLNDLLDKMLRGESLKLTQLLGDELEPIEAALNNALSPTPEDRYASVNDFRRALEQAIWAIEEKKERIENPDIQRLLPVTLPSSRSGTKWLSFHSRNRKRSLKLIFASLVVIGLGVILSINDYATANSRHGVHADLHILDAETWLPSFFEKSTAYAQVKPLTKEIHVGLLYNLLEDGQDVRFTTAEIKGSPNSFLISVDIAGFKPKVVTLKQDSKSKDIVISSGGLQLLLQVEKIVREPNAIVGGLLKDLKSGRQGRWAVFAN